MAHPPQSRLKSWLVGTLCITTGVAFSAFALGANAILALILYETQYDWKTLNSAYPFEIITLSLVAMLCILVAYATISFWIRWRR